MTSRPELLEASDEEIEEFVLYTDPMALRGLLYQLTGDEAVAATATMPASFGFLTARALASPTDVAVLQAKGAEFLKSYRDQGAGVLPIGPRERLRVSLGLAGGQDIPERDMAMWLEELALEPWARSLEWSRPPEPEKLAAFRVLVIGAGMSGINAAIQLKRAGIPYTLVEKNSDLGGTWFENRYPGARVDTPSKGYTHIQGADFEYPYPFGPQSENERYLQWLAESFDVRQHIEFDTEVKSLVWDERAHLWEAQATGPEGPHEWRVSAVISAVGFLSRPSTPDLDGAAEFKGELFHTARWPDGLDITGKRVAVIGSGCSGYQTFPEIAKVAAHTYLFQRAPSWVYEIAGYLDRYPPQVNWLERNFPYYRNFLRFRAQWLFGPEVLGRDTFSADPKHNGRIRAQRLDFMRRKFADRPDLMEKMLPQHPPMTSRPVLVDEDYSVYDALLQEDTTLVTDGITRLTATGIVDGNGDEHRVDVVVLATGFKANDFLWPMEIRGRDGLSVEQLWEKDGARAYLGTMLPGFPNFFTLYGPNINSTGGPGNPAIEEQQTRFALMCMEHLILHDKKTVDVTLDAYWCYNNEVDEAENTKIYATAAADNYYTTQYGRSAVNCPFDARKLWEWLRDPTGDYSRTAPSDSVNAKSRVRPYYGQDLVVD
jgi:4-hydroxyacetophenone monooxygenase